MQRFFFYFLLILTITSCDRQSFEERFMETCPYERRFPVYHHQLVIPVEIIPHQKMYKVGDTMTIRSVFSDSIYDNNFQTYFKVKNFPFRPAKALYKFTEEGFDYGFRLNELIVDDQYDHQYFSKTTRADESVGRVIYDAKEGYYHYEIKIVLQTPGVYSTIMDEVFNNTPKDFQQERLEEVLSQIEFDEYCGESFSIKTVISGEPHYNDFIDELIYLDEFIFWDDLNSFNGPISNGNDPIEWNGVFLFEVVE